MPDTSLPSTIHRLGRSRTGAAAKDILEAIVGLAVIVVGIYLAFFVLGLVLRIVALAVVVIAVVFLFAKLVQGARKMGGD